MAERLFGTDGLRGPVNIYPMTVDVALRLGLAAGVRFRKGSHQHRVVIGKDTRLSGYMFESAITAGLCAAGMHVIMTGPLPTPAISFLTRNMRADLGVVISASHNPYSDNGIKFFDADGFKLPDEVENEISAMVLDPDMRWPYPDSNRVGRASKIEDAGGRYIVYTKSCFPAHLTLSGLRIVIDCANGAAYKVAPLALEELGAEVFRLGTSPNGTNINDHCGSLHPETLAAKVREVRADVGLALDGDADRLIVVDEKGNVLDGDQLMALGGHDGAGRTARQHAGGYGHEQPGAGDLHEGTRRYAAAHQGGRPLRHGSHAQDRRHAGRRAVRAPHLPPVQHHR